jgi:Dyp-type peroxidase family
MTITTDITSVVEPVLETGEIQGHLLPGFNKNFQQFLFIKIIDPPQFKQWLSKVCSGVTTLKEILSPSEVNSNQDDKSTIGLHGSWLSIALSSQGLCRLNSLNKFIDSAFTSGLHKRSELLGDPTNLSSSGNCHNWVVGGPHNVPDLMLILANDYQDNLIRAVDEIKNTINGGFEVIFQQAAAVLPEPLKHHEHFGFRDCISQPCIRGRISTNHGDFITPHEDNRDLIWPGEFIFGYPKQSPMNKLLPGAVADAGCQWARNGSFLVVRRLRQNVEGFRTFLKSVTQELSDNYPSLARMTTEQLAAKLMGRWFSGAPILLAPEQDNEMIAADSLISNDFTYECDTLLPLKDRAINRFSTSDPLGLVCPHAAHIRKAFPRDTTTMIGDEAENQTHRLLRRGIPFGDVSPSEKEQGLLFVAYQTSIERQFEFITTNWINNANFPSSGAGHDPIVGQNMNLQENRVRTWSLPIRQPDGDITKISIDLPTDWVVPTGGGYFFSPSISSLRSLAT